jgi:hypothetical protein
VVDAQHSCRPVAGQRCGHSLGVVHPAQRSHGGTTTRQIGAPRARFDRSLDGGTIALTLVADAHTLLKGEVMGIQQTPSGPVSYLVGYFDRDYGPSALVARKNVVIDASDLPNSITLAWAGPAPGARVLAVEGDV